MKCVYCGTKQFEILFVVRGRKIVCCTKCELVKTDDTNFENYDEYHRDEREYKVDEELFRNIFQKRYNTISKFRAKPGKVLDIGSSTGTMLSIFKDNGWDVWGVEPSSSASYAKKKGIKTTRLIFEKAKLPKNCFDVVIMNHTFEHVEDPVAVVAKIKLVLKKGGIAYIDVPNFGGLDSKLKGDKWGYLMPEEHTYHYTPETLRKIIKKGGLKVVWWDSWSGVFDVESPAKLFWYNLVNLKMAFIKNLIKIPLNTVTTLTKRGSSLAVIGRK